MNKFLALVRRALQTETRLVRSYLARFGLGAFVLWSLFAAQQDMFYRDAPGLVLFRNLSTANFFFVTVLGTAFFATAITEEKEERTLSLLKMADVGATALILGKWAPRLIGAAMLVAIQIPFTALAITLGGVLWNQVGATFLALFAHLFLVGNIGLFCSVVMSSTTGACGVACAILVSMHLLPVLLRLVFQPTGGFGLSQMMLHVADWWQGLLWEYRLNEILSTGFNDSWVSSQVVCHLVGGGLFMLASWLLFEVCTRNEPEPGALTVFDRMRKSLARSSGNRVWAAPLTWKEFQFLGGGSHFLLAKFAIYFGGILALACLNRNPYVDFRELLGWFLFGWSLFFIFVEFAIMTARLYRKELSEQTWSTLMLIPRSPAEIIYTKLLGGMSVLLPLLACIAFSFFIIPDEYADAVYDILRDLDDMIILAYFVLQYFLGAHLSVLLSVTQKWAHWPVAVFLAGLVIFMANAMVFSCLIFSGGPGDEEVFFFLGCLVTCMIIAPIHLSIGHRLVALAGE